MNKTKKFREFFFSVNNFIVIVEVVGFTEFLINFFKLNNNIFSFSFYLKISINTFKFFFLYF